MTTPVYNDVKSLQTVLYVAGKNQSKDFHKIFKIIYFADRAHLSKYGRPITGDTYIAMEFGPVPSYIYDWVKQNSKPNYLNIVGYNIEPKVDADLSKLSVSDVRALDESIEEYGDLDMGILTQLSHQFAWSSASKNGLMSIENILKETGSDQKYIDYICEHIALEKSLLY